MTIAMTPLLQDHQHQGFPLTASGEAVATFGNDADIFQNFSNGVFVYDQSHWGLLQFTGADRQRYLHNQSTNQIQQLRPGQSCDTVFVNSTARTIDLATIHILREALWVQVSPQKKTVLLEWFERFLFPMDKVDICDLSGQFNILSLMGSQATTILETLSGTTLATFPAGGHQFLEIQGQNILCATGNSLKRPGYTLYVPAEAGVAIWQALLDLGTIPCGEKAWEKLRIHQGRPAPNQELTEDYNPLEAGLWDCISFDKGCYIGQETIARLNTYKGVKQRLFGIQLSAPVEVPCKIFVGEERAGVITSIDPDEAFALGYVRAKVGGEGLEITAGAVTGKVVAVPYVTHTYPQP
ncbi:folate-binding protein YgfZ [Synechococcus moorigangaii CMS01]|nr:folate-binding protein YgfZ [Synechococcus moorigangaii CMS01]